MLPDNKTLNPVSHFSPSTDVSQYSWLFALFSHYLCCLHCFPIICAAKTALLLDTLCSHKSCFYALTASHMCYHYYLQLRTSINTYNFSQTLLCSYNFSQAQTTCRTSHSHNYLLSHHGCCGGERRSLRAALFLCSASWAGKAGLPLHSC